MATENTSVDDIIVDEEISKEIPKEIPKVKPPKIKNPKRIEQGRRLVEWNKKNKERRKMQPATQPATQPPMQPAMQPATRTQKDNTDYWMLGGVIVIGGIVVSLIYFIQRGETNQQVPKQVPEQVPKQAPDVQKDDPFNMV